VSAKCLSAKRRGTIARTGECSKFQKGFIDLSLRFKSYPPYSGNMLFRFIYLCILFLRKLEIRVLSSNLTFCLQMMHFNIFPDLFSTPPPRPHPPLYHFSFPLSPHSSNSPLPFIFLSFYTSLRLYISSA
jgi:hypothetical protein